jgi:imidazolonepropionase-like amidohydrolase
MKTNIQSNLVFRIVAAVLLTVFVAADVCAQPSQDKDPQSATSTEKKKNDKKKARPVTAIVGADIYTVTREVIRRGTVLIQDGKILEVGQGITIPEDATVIDAAGMVVTPGFVSLSTSRVGLNGRSGSREKFKDQLDPFDANVQIALGVGITTGCVQVRSGSSRFRRRSEGDLFPGLDPVFTDLVRESEDFNTDFGDPNTSVCPCCGLPILSTEPITPPRPEPIKPQENAVIKMSARHLDGMLVTDSVFFHVTPGALNGALNRHQWRETISKAREYLKKQAEHEEQTKAGKKQRPPRKSVSDGVLKLVKHEVSLRVSADSVSAIRDMIALAKELDYTLVIDSAIEGWVIPDELAEAGVSVVITPRQRRSAEFAKQDSTGSNIQSSGILERAGVPFAVTPLSSSISLNGLAGRDLTSLPLEAAFAVRGGCSEKTALEALTIVPARMLGLEDRIGSIEVGKDADLLILNGSPLDYRTYVETAIVNGLVAYERDKDKVFPVYER